MNPRLSPDQIADIFDAADHVDVPVEQLLDAAAEIRATLLAASGEISLLADASPVVDDQPTRRAQPVRRVDAVRRARTVRTALVAAVLTIATLLSVAVAGALPDPLQEPIAQAAKLFGIDLPKADAAPTVETPSGSQGSTNGTPATNAGAKVADATAAADNTASTPGAAPADDQGNGNAYGQDPGVPGNGNAYGQDPGVPGNGNAYGQDPGIPGNGNAYGQPPDQPATEQPVNPGNGSDDGCNGNGNCYGHYK
jgi:hypothetical protein